MTIKPALPHKFYPIVDDVTWVERLLPLGVSFVQLRIKNKSGPDLENQIKTAIDIQKKYDATIVINDYWKCAIKCGGLYVHLGQEDLESADVKAIKKSGIKFGISTHNHKELENALSYDPDYIALGPIFHPIAKQMTIKPQGLDRIREWKSLTNGIPLVAIGGIRLENVKDVLAYGADTIACIGDILQSENPENQARKWLAAVHETS